MLSKEVALTILGVVLVYDVAAQPWLHPAVPLPAGRSRRALPQLCDRRPLHLPLPGRLSSARGEERAFHQTDSIPDLTVPAPSAGFHRPARVRGELRRALSRLPSGKVTRALALARVA